MEKQLLENLENIRKEFQESNEKLLDSKVLSDVKQVTKLKKFIKRNKNKIKLFDEWEQLHNDIKDANNIIIISETESPELVKDLKEMILENKDEIIKVEEQLIELMIEKDENDERDVIIEIQGAAGGDEAKIFVGDLFRMYQKYISKEEWTLELIDEAEAEMGGFSNISFYVRGTNVYEHLKYESGVHRVQRVPTTETQGRVHTSTATVSVMPEVEDVELEINPSDLRIDTYRSGGKGGQHANKTDSAVRITHIPTGIVAQSQDGRSQHHNKDIALQILKARIYNIQVQEEAEKNAGTKKNLIGSGDRSEKIRTYNYPQNRITDHRVGLTLKKLDRVMDGGLDEIVNFLIQTSKNKV